MGGMSGCPFQLGYETFMGDPCMMEESELCVWA